MKTIKFNSDMLVLKQGKKTQTRRLLEAQKYKPNDFVVVADMDGRVK